MDFQATRKSLQSRERELEVQPAAILLFSSDTGSVEQEQLVEVRIRVGQ